MSDDAQTERDRVHAAGLLDAQRRMQDGIATYAQLVAGGVTRIDIERRLRRNELRRIHPRVYADHTGPLTWLQRAWAAVLYAEPAFLCGVSLEPPKGQDLGDPIHVAIDRSRRVRPQDGLVIHRLATSRRGPTVVCRRASTSRTMRSGWLTRRATTSTPSRRSRKSRAGPTSPHPRSVPRSSATRRCVAARSSPG